MSLGEHAQEAATDVKGRSLRAFVAPRVDAYEIRRLLLVAGCIAAAAAANFAGTAMPQRTPVAVGSALLGALLVLRRRRAGDVAPAEPGAAAVETVEEVEVAAVAGLPGKHRRSRAVQVAALNAWLLDVRHQLEAHEQRLTSLSGRQTLIDVNAREKLAELLNRIEELEADRAQLMTLCETMRDENRASLQRLQTVFVDHQRAIAQLVQTYGHRP